jgi:archaellum component FlaG (FlaF/FlaG flagellin family)
MKKIIYILFAFLVPALYAQNGILTFEKTEHDFAEIVEGTQPQYIFKFKNTGTTPISLTEVHPGCGCTTPSWTNSPIPVGGTGEIKVVFNSAHYAGPFRKPIVVATDGAPSSMTLFISGLVKPLTLDRSVAQGNMAFNTEIAELGGIETGKTAKYTFYVQNIGTRPIRVTKANPSDPRIKVQFPAQAIFVKDVVAITVEMNTDGLKAGEVFEHSFSLDTNDPINPRKSLRISGVMVMPWTTSQN